MPKTRKNVMQYKPRPKVILVGKIYAKWCGHCQMLKPEWNKMKSSIRSKMNAIPNVFVRFIEIEQQQEQQKVDKVNRIYLTNSNEKLALQGGYPTLFRIEDGKLQYFQGSRNAEEMESWYVGGSLPSGGDSKDPSAEKEESHDEPVPSKKNKETRKNRYNLFNIFGGKTRRNRSSKQIHNKTKSLWNIFS
jgi:thiol-disulfide isomerase/thioredoxin